MIRSRDKYEVYEQMHWVCFHYEFEHPPQDPDIACEDHVCPARTTDPDPPIDWLTERGARP